MICLDTNVVIAVIGNRPPSAREQMEHRIASRETICISAIVAFEMRFGIAKSSRRAASEFEFRSFLHLGIVQLAWDENDAAEAGQIRADLQQAGTPIGPYDLLIAAQARRRGATLVTASTREFSRVPGLLLEDWSG